MMRKLNYIMIAYWYKIFAVGVTGLLLSCTPGSADPEGGNGTGNEDAQPGQVKQLDYGELLAFPYAEGHGRNTEGGRGGTVYHVTNFSDAGEGSFRYAAEKDHKRTIVFDISGTIHLTRPLKIKGDVTIAGQTSPGGVCIAGQPVTIAGNNVIIRFMRFRPGNVNVDCDGLGGMDQKNIIVDHCSVSWSSDEVLSVYAMENSTVQWCYAYQALRVTPAKDGKAHGYGGNWGGINASYLYNMIAHCNSRVPRLGPRYTTQMNERVDIRNNIFYNWDGEGCYGGEYQFVNLVNNYYKPGPATSSKRAERIAKIGVRTDEYVTKYPDFAPAKGLWGKFYIDGNHVDGHSDVTADNWTNGVIAQIDKTAANYWTSDVPSRIKLDSPLDFAGAKTWNARIAYENVLQYGGASNYRDGLDKLIAGDVRDRKATVGNSGSLKGYIDSPEELKTVSSISFEGDTFYPVLPSDSSREITDSDGDGIPDSWEYEYGLNKNYALDGRMKTIDVHGKYTNLEMYLNSLVHSIMSAPYMD